MGATPPPLPPEISRTKAKISQRVLLGVVVSCVALLLVEVAILVARNRPRRPSDIFDASRVGDTRRINEFLASGSSVNARGKFGETPLIQGVWGKHPQTVQFLIQRGADVNATDNEGTCALIWAARQGFGMSDTIGALIHNGAALNLQDKQGNTAVICAMRNGFPELAKLLLEAGADVNVENADGETALTKAGQRGYVDMVEFFKQRGALKTNVFLNTSRYPVTPLRPAQLWALATTALLVQYNGESHELLGSVPRSEGDYARRQLRNWWHITSRDGALRTLDGLWLKHRDAVSQPDLLAWDLCRHNWVAGQSCVAGYLTEEEAWAKIMPAAQKLQQGYHSWQEMGTSYLLGRTKSKGERDARFEYVMKLLSNPDDPNSPWTKNRWDIPLAN